MAVKWERATTWFMEDGETPSHELDVLVYGPFAILPTMRNGRISPDGEPYAEAMSPFRETLWPAPDEWMVTHRIRHRIVGHCPTEEQARAFCEAAIAAHGDLWELGDWVDSEQRERMKAWQLTVVPLYFWPVALGSQE